jgi:hypothetical protein
MKQTEQKYRVRTLVAGALLALALGACGGQEPTSTAVAQVSPLGGSTSPLAQPESPLTPTLAATVAEAAGQPTVPGGPHIEIEVPRDFAAISQVAQDTVASVPQEGMASLSGVLYSPVVNRIIPGTQFYLTPAIEDNGQLFIPSMFVGPQVDKGDVMGFTNEKGQMLLDNVPPGNYYLAVWTVYNWPLAFAKPDDELPLLITLEAGDQRDLGLLYIDWP